MSHHEILQNQEGLGLRPICLDFYLVVFLSRGRNDGQIPKGGGKCAQPLSGGLRYKVTERESSRVVLALILRGAPATSQTSKFQFSALASRGIG